MQKIIDLGVPSVLLNELKYINMYINMNKQICLATKQTPQIVIFISIIIQSAYLATLHYKRVRNVTMYFICFS